jgi:hypothetical protein
MMPFVWPFICLVRSIERNFPKFHSCLEAPLDYETFDNEDVNASDDDYAAFVGWLSQLAAAELREARGEPDRQKQALCRYYIRGERGNLTPAELLDFLCANTPSILDRAGYTEEEGDALMEISDSLVVEVNTTGREPGRWRVSPAE